MGTVFLGRRRGAGGFERLVAMKRCEVFGERERERFFAEARIAGLIHHPNVVPTLDVTEASGEIYHVMEYVEGANLGELAAATARPPLEIVMRVAIDALHGLNAIHNARDSSGQALNLVHLDVSPQNVLIGVDGVSRVLDFGIARTTATPVTSPHMVRGKLAYLAPEQLDRGEATPATDVYACAVVLWEQLVGRPLFDAPTNAEIAAQVLQGDVPVPSRVAPHVPPAVDRPVMTALHPDPAKRFASAAEFAAALEQAFAHPANAAEVGAFVQDAVGDSLRERRERAEAQAERTRGDKTLSRGSTPIAVAASVHPASGAAASLTPNSAATFTGSGPTVRPKVVGLLPGLAASALGGGVVVAAWLLFTPSSIPSATRPPAVAGAPEVPAERDAETSRDAARPADAATNQAPARSRPAQMRRRPSPRPASMNQEMVWWPGEL